jgi:hypothetical protein
VRQGEWVARLVCDPIGDAPVDSVGSIDRWLSRGGSSGECSFFAHAVPNQRTSNRASSIAATARSGCSMWESARLLDLADDCFPSRGQRTGGAETIGASSTAVLESGARANVKKTEPSLTNNRQVYFRGHQTIANKEGTLERRMLIRSTVPNGSHPLAWVQF